VLATQGELNQTSTSLAQTGGGHATRGDAARDRNTEGELDSSQMLFYSPTPAVTQALSNAQRVRAVRVHHCNLFMKREVRQFVQGIVLGK
jgi:hypothetical protein